MKLIITIIPGNTRENVSLALTDRKFRVTQIASTGGFLRKGNATLLVGVEDEQLDEAIGMSNHETICEELGRELIYEVCEAPYRKVARRVQEITGMSLSHQQIWTYIQKNGEKNSDNLIKMQNLEKSGESRGEIPESSIAIAFCHIMFPISS